VGDAGGTVVEVAGGRDGITVSVSNVASGVGVWEGSGEWVTTGVGGAVGDTGASIKPGVD